MTTPFEVTSGTTSVQGDLTVPADARGMVVFAHGSGSSRHSPRNEAVARTLQDARFATLLFDLLSPEEDRTGNNRFDIDLLSARLLAAMDELVGEPSVAGLPLGLFGASTGAAATLRVAAERPHQVRAVVSRGGRPDLAGAALPKVTSRVLLIVGERDRQVLELNEQAATRLAGSAEVRVVPGASHLFEEPGTLETVAHLAEGWFDEHLLPAP